MRVLALIPSLAQTSPGSRFRIEQWAPYLGGEDIDIEIASFEDEALHEAIYQPGRYLAKIRLMLGAVARRLRAVRSAIGRFDAVFLYEEAARLGPPFLEQYLGRHGMPIVYDFCDPVWLPYVSPRNSYLSRLKFPGKTATICALSHEILVGNEDLAGYARQHNPRVTVVPITIDTKLYVPRTDHVGSVVPTVGWSGSHSTLPHLKSVQDALAELSRRRKFRLIILGVEDGRLSGVACETRPWRLQHEVSDLQQFDVGIMPLPDDPWTRLRSQLKVRQYMGLAIPTVASPVGVIRDLVKDGVNGSLATSPEEWVSKISLLLDNHELRHRLGTAGRRTIEEGYSARFWAPRVGAVIRRAVARASLDGSGGVRPVGEARGSRW